MITIADRPMKDYEKFLLDLINSAEGCKIRGLAVVALLEEPVEGGGDAMTAYYDMSFRDRCFAASLIQSDITYGIAQDAVRDLLGLQEPDEEEC